MIPCFAFNSEAYAQKTAKIQLIKADNLVGKKTAGETINVFIGNVIFEHDSASLFCDSAVFNNTRNNLDAYGKVHILMNDTLSLYSDALNYNGNTKIAVATDNVRLVDNKTILTTDRLIYDRNTRIASYSTGGKIISDDNELTSRLGYYHTNVSELYFKKDVVLINPEYVLNSDTLLYNTSTKIVTLLSPTTIRGDDEFLYAEDGWYDTKTDKSELKINPYIYYKAQYLSGDRIMYDKGNGHGQAFGNISLKDTIRNILLTGDFADYRRQEGHAFVTDSAVAILIDRTDSLFLHADTLSMTLDTLQKPSFLYSYYHSRFYKTDLQGKCDSLVYNFTDSTITMFHQPALWSEANQLTADLITIYTSGQKIDSLRMDNASFIISTDKYDSLKFNQIKGKFMVGYFWKNELYRIDVKGNSETIYYAREDNGSLMGINKALSSDMKIFISDRRISNIYYFNKPDANLYPENEFPKEELLLRGFKWLGIERPKNKLDIFRNNNSIKDSNK